MKWIGEHIWDLTSRFRNDVYITDGKLGIGTSSPDSLLEISSSSATDFLKLTSGGGGANPVKLIFEKSSVEQGIIEYNRNGDLEIYNTDSDGGVMIDGSASGGSDLYVSNSGNTTLGGRTDIQKDLRLRGTDSAANQGVVRFYVDSSNKLFIDTANDGSNLFAIDSSGNVGIGITNPAYILDTHSGTTNVAARFKSGDNQAWISVQDDDSGTYGALFGTDSDAGHHIVLADRSANKRLVINSSGNVGIGTTSPAQKLHVDGNIRVGDTADTIYSNRLFPLGNADFTITSYNGYDLLLNPSAGDNVGIGTTSPGGKLDVAGDTNARVILGKAKFDSYVSDYLYLSHFDQGSATNYALNQSPAGSTSINAPTGQNVALKINNSAKLHVQGTTGNVGIGTTSPSELLTIAAESPTLRFEDISSSNYTEMYVNNFDTYLNTNGRFFIQNQGSTKVTFKSDGNVGIGTTSPSEKLEVDGNVTISGYYYADTHFQSKDSNATLSAIGGGGVYLRPNGAFSATGQFLVHHTTGNVDVSGNISIGDGKYVYLGDDNDLRLIHSSNSFLQNFTGDLYIENAADDKDIIFNCDDGSGGVAEYFRVDGSDHSVFFSKTVKIADSKYVGLGDSFDFHLQHDGTDSKITNSTGDLIIQNEANDKDVIFKSDDGSGGVTNYLKLWGAVESLAVYKDMLFVYDGDGGKLKFGASQDLQIYHDGSNSYIKDTGTGNLRVDATNFFVRNSGGTKIAIDALDGAEVALRYDGSRKLETTSTGVEVTGNINVSGSVQRQISTTHHTFTTVNGGSSTQDYWVPFIGSAEQAAPNVTHRTIAPYGGILKKAIVHSTAAFGSSAQVRFHRIDNGTASVFTNDNSTDDVTTNVTRSLATAYTSTEFVFTTGNTFSTGDQIGVSFVRDNTAQGDVAMTLVWEYELF